MNLALGRRFLAQQLVANRGISAQSTLITPAISGFYRRFAAQATAPKVTEDAPLETPKSDKEIPLSPKVEKLVDEITRLTLLETAQLVKALKVELNIQDSMMSMPVGMPMAHAGGAAPAAAAPAPVEEEKPAEKTEFTLKLEKFDATAKAKVIREIKNILPNANLVEAKKFVESAPKVIKEKVPKEEAEKIKKALEAVGATVLME